MATPDSRNVTGKTRVTINRLIEANGGKPLPITLKTLDEKRTGKYSEILSNEIVLTVRQHAPIRVEKWKQVSQFEINANA